MLKSLWIVSLILCFQATTRGEEEVFKELDASRQESLYYTADKLPDAVKNLIKKEMVIDQLFAEYQKTGDEKKKFNLIIILEGKLDAGQYQNEEKAKAVDFLRGALKSGNPWLKAEAVYALGNLQVEGAKEDIQGCLSNTSLIVSYNAYVAYKQIFKEEPALTAEQKEKFNVFTKALAQNDLDIINQLADKELAEFLASSKSEGAAKAPDAKTPDPKELLGKGSDAPLETIFTKPVAKAEAVPRLAMPDPAGQKAALAELRKDFVDDLANHKPAQRRELIAKFLELAHKTKGDANRLWAQLEEAIDLALEIKEYQTVLALCDYRAARFEGLEALTQRKEAFGKAKTSPVIAAAIILLEKPIDPNANLAVGRFFCFDQANWEVGLPLLAFGADADLKRAAELELAKPGEAVKKKAVGDLWYDLGMKAKKPLKEPLLTRGLFWYQQAKTGLTGAVKDQVAKRIEEISALLPPPPIQDWDKLTAKQWDQLKGEEFTICGPQEFPGHQHPPVAGPEGAGGPPSHRYLDHAMLQRHLHDEFQGDQAEHLRDHDGGGRHHRRFRRSRFPTGRSGGLCRTEKGTLTMSA